MTASDARALAENVTLSFTSEAESDGAGIKELRIVLPKGIAPNAVALKDAPKGWKLTATADGYTVRGKALTVGTDAEHSITVRQLPDAKSLAFKTLETYSDGKMSRWIEVPGNGEKAENPAPVLELKAAAPGAEPIAPNPSPKPRTSTPSKGASSPAASTSGKQTKAEAEEDSGSSTGALVIVIAVVVLLGGAGVFWWLRRSRTQA